MPFFQLFGGLSALYKLGIIAIIAASIFGAYKFQIWQAGKAGQEFERQEAEKRTEKAIEEAGKAANAIELDFNACFDNEATQWNSATSKCEVKQ